MIKDLAAYQRRRVRADREALQAMDLDASIAIAEALLTSSVMDAGAAQRRPRPRDLARALGIQPARLRRGARLPR